MMREAILVLPRRIKWLMNTCTGTVVAQIGIDLASDGACPSRHALPSALYFFAALGRLTPYFERPCCRFSTPAVSNTPRTTW